MSVLSQASGRGDVHVRRGTDFEWTVFWDQDAGSGFQPVDLTGWSGVLVVRSLTGDVWLEKPVTTSMSGHTIAHIAPADMAGPVWAARVQGEWYINLTDPDGRIDRLGDGYFWVEA